MKTRLLSCFIITVLIGYMNIYALPDKPVVDLKIVTYDPVFSGNTGKIVVDLFARGCDGQVYQMEMFQTVLALNDDLQDRITSVSFDYFIFNRAPSSYFVHTVHDEGSFLYNNGGGFILLSASKMCCGPWVPIVGQTPPHWQFISRMSIHFTPASGKTGRIKYDVYGEPYILGRSSDGSRYYLERYLYGSPASVPLSDKLVVTPKQLNVGPNGGVYSVQVSSKYGSTPIKFRVDNNTPWILAHMAHGQTPATVKFTVLENPNQLIRQGSVRIIAYDPSYVDDTEQSITITQSQAFGPAPPRSEWLSDGEFGMEKVPKQHVLSQNYPNPFNPLTTIPFALPSASNVQLDVFNMKGERVTRIVDGQMPAGYHRVNWSAVDDNGEPLPSGIYIYTLRAGDFSATKKFTLLK